VIPLLAALTLTIPGVPARLGGPVGPIALDGRYAAYSVVRDSMAGCHFAERVYRLDLTTRKSTLASGATTCAQEQTSTGRGIDELAVAGKRTTWLVNEGGNTESDDLLFSSTASGRDAVVARSTASGPDLDTLAGSWIGGLVSDGSRVTYSTWTSSGAGALHRFPGPKALAQDGGGAVVDSSADAGRVAVLRAGGSVSVYGIAGQLLATVQAANARGVALAGSLLATLVKGGTLDVYDRTTGALVHAWPVAPGATTVDASNGVAAYVAGAAVHVLDLSTGRDVTVATGKRRQVTGARIDAAGLLYAYDTRTAGTIVFVPFARVAKSLSA
jgi:hypothetical protein